MLCVDAALAWLSTIEDGSAVAIIDATNTTKARRAAVLSRVQTAEQQTSIRVLFLESICDDPVLLEVRKRRGDGAEGAGTGGGNSGVGGGGSISQLKTHHHHAVQLRNEVEKR